MCDLGKGSEEKKRKICALLTNRGGVGIWSKKEEANLYFGKVFFQLASFRTLGTFIVGGFPMLKTVKKRKWDLGRPPPVFFKILTFFGGELPSGTM